MNIYDDISCIKGIGPKTQKMFNQCGIFSILDLILYFPRDYEKIYISHNYNIISNKQNIIKVHLVKINNDIKKKGKIMTSMLFNDGKNTIKCIWFNAPYIKRNFKFNQEYILRGKVEVYKNKYFLFSPKIINNINFDINENVLLEPKYDLKGNIKNNIIIKAIDKVLAEVSLEENLPKSIIDKYNYCSLDCAIRNIHKPQSIKLLKESLRRLKFQEMLTYCLKILLIKNYINEHKCGISFKKSKELDDLIKTLPFKLTNAQSKVINEILLDEKKSSPMNRLLQGDVGSGKTIVAAISMFNVVKNGYQVAMMAPTEILAKQHFTKINDLMRKFDVKVELLTSSIKNTQKEIIKKDLKEGNIDIIIGTHALIQDNVQFKNLGLIVTDEQHRFGVMQRNKLANKGNNPDVLVMTATPIPRTLSLYLYGDLDISIIDELPPGRKNIKTYYVTDSYRDRVYNFALKQIKCGSQVYIVCPLIENNDDNKLVSVEGIYNRVKKKYFKDLEVGILHGKMKSIDKQEIMEKFKNNQIKVLLSTTVIEVGVDVPNATVMIIENAERFGLAQLHQLRGRVGRGDKESYCILIADIKNKIIKKRMEIMKNSNNGFYIAEEDLKIRGEGELLGFKQHGDNELKLCSLTKDFDIIKIANLEAKRVYKSSNKEDLNLKKKIMKIISLNSTNICFN